MVENAILADEISVAMEKVKEGESLSSTLKDSEVLSALVIGMIAAGEASDQVDGLMGKVGQIYEKEVDTAIKTMTNSLEPILMIIIGGFLLVIMMAIMLPMMDLVQQINF